METKTVKRQTSKSLVEIPRSALVGESQLKSEEPYSVVEIGNSFSVLGKDSTS
jgi:hypothetical protein